MALGRVTRSPRRPRPASPARVRSPGTRGRSPVRNGEGGTGRTGGGSRVPPSPGRSFPRDRGMRKAQWAPEGGGRRELRRRRGGPRPGEPRTEPPSKAAEPVIALCTGAIAAERTREGNRHVPAGAYPPTATTPHPNPPHARG